MWIWLLIIFLVVVVVGAWRGANQSYTVGSGLFKRSDNNLNKDEHLDVSDYNYYNKEDKLK